MALKRIVRLFLLLILLSFSITQKFHRELTLLSIDCKSSHPNLTDGKALITTKYRGVQTFSGFYYISKEALDADMVAYGSLFYNPSYNGDFKMSIFNLPDTNVLDFMNSYYQTYLRKTVSNCSNVPQQDGVFTSYQELANNYTFNDCVLHVRESLGMLRPGYYMVKASQYRRKPPYFNSSYGFNFYVENVEFDSDEENENDEDDN